MELIVGTSGFAYPKWKGSFYPKALPAKQMLKHYAEHFRSVEINYTFKSLPTASMLETWKGQVPADFTFAFKAPERITHIKRLKAVDELMEQFFKAVGDMGDRLGPTLFQLPPNFKRDASRLQEFLELLPMNCRVAIEFRHASWFDDEVLELLRKHQVALCIADAGDDLKVPCTATANWGYLRLRRDDYSGPELKAWLKQIKKQKWEEAFVFFKHDDVGNGPRLAKSLLKLVA
jgi:uncharacterized protein YecE (DUF72 family)